MPAAGAGAVTVIVPVGTAHVGCVVTLAVGAAGAVFGAATPDPEELVQLFAVWVTVYVPAVFTVMEFVVAPLLHKIVAPLTIPVAVRVDVPSQFSTTVTIGAAGGVGAALTVTAVAAEIQPDAFLTVTLYGPGATPVNTPVVLV